MPLLFTGTGIADFWDGSTLPSESSSVTTAAEIASYVDEGVGVDGVTDTRPLKTPSATIWHAFTVYLDNWDMHSVRTVEWFDDTDTALFRLNKPQDDSTTTVEYWDGAAWQAFANTFEFTGSGAKDRWDIKIVLSDTVGEIEIFKNAVSVWSFSGDNLLNGSGGTQVKSFRLGGRRFFNKQTTFSAVFVCDEDTRSMTYVQTTPSSAGNYTDWTGAYTDIDGAGFTDGDDISTQNAGDKATFGQGTLTTDFDTGYDVVGIAVNARANKAGGLPLGIKLMVRSGTTDGVGTEQSLALAKQPFYEIFNTDPATGSQWTISAVKAAEIGIEST